jgi:cytochrome c553
MSEYREIPMNHVRFIYICLLVMAACIIVGLVELSVLSHGLESRANDCQKSIALLRDSIAVQRTHLDSLNAQAPGLGDYMSTIQLHAAKIWFAAQALNWNLAGYELGELKETFDGADALHVMKNKVDISGVIQSVKNTQIETLESAVRQKNLTGFVSGYRQTLEACNACHGAAGYGFIHVKIPSAEPVTNQIWKPASN